MLLGGDEFRRTQRGNNNAYCQDNPISWFDWTYLEQHQEIYRFARGMITFRGAHPVLREEQFYTDAGIEWFAPHGGAPNWADPKTKQFACLIHEEQQCALCLIYNASADPVEFDLPPLLPGSRWYLAVDTSLPSPRDFFAAGEETLMEESKTYPLKARSSVILIRKL